MLFPDYVYYADCAQFDDCRTGYYLNKDEALTAFWALNGFTDFEKTRVAVTVHQEPVTDDTFATAGTLLDFGRPSPALGIDAR